MFLEQTLSPICMGCWLLCYVECLCQFTAVSSVSTEVLLIIALLFSLLPALLSLCKCILLFLTILSRIFYLCAIFSLLLECSSGFPTDTPLLTFSLAWGPFNLVQYTCLFWPLTIGMGLSFSAHKHVMPKSFYIHGFNKYQSCSPETESYWDFLTDKENCCFFINLHWLNN